MKVAMLHLREDRPDAPDYHKSLTELTKAADRAVASLGWESVSVAGCDATIKKTLDAVSQADCIVILGGDDVAPELYGGSVDYSGVEGQRVLRADTAQIAAIAVAIETKKPLLGVCRGMQLINTALGGTLIQHIDGPIKHIAPGDGWESFVQNGVRVNPDSDLAQDFAASEPNCSHHQAIDELGEDLTVEARASDGIIEAIVHTSAPITGVQWHPEHPEYAQDQLVGLLKRLERQSNTAQITQSVLA